MQLGVFPLPVFLLPGGITHLRIFEPRYLRLIKESAGGEGFALAVFQQGAPFDSHVIAPRVEIIDFTTLEDGLLGVTVRAKELVQLVDFQWEDDKLRKATALPLKHWPDTQPQNYTMALKEMLSGVFHSQPELSALYPEAEFDDHRWVCGRFIELLPLPTNEKLIFYNQTSEEKACTLINTLLFGE